MRMGRFSQRRVLVASLIVGLLFLPNPVYALFGEDIPVLLEQLATQGKQLITQGNQLQTAIQMYNTASHLYETTTAYYNLAKAMSARVSNRSTWLTTAGQVVGQQVQSRYGETVNWQAVANGNWSQAGTAWRSATLDPGPAAHLQSQTPGSSTHLANLASIEALDGSATACLETVSRYKFNSQGNATAVAGLLGKQVDDSDPFNTQIAQLNLLNAGDAQKAQEQRSQGLLSACLVEQQMIGNTFQRNLAAEGIRMFGDRSTASSRPVTLGGMSSTIQSAQIQ